MAEHDEDNGSAVPSHRLSRLARFTGLAGSIAGNMAVEGAKQLARGDRPAMSDLLLTPANARKVADQLANLRGAAMKVGQLLSMDAGELLPPELADVLSRLRASAEPMPAAQLRRVMSDSWGRDWLRNFSRFDVKPVAAASIGQVHRAKTRDGRDLAVKVQYPGVRESIDSDVDNLATLIRMAGVLPQGVNVAPLLTEAKRQLKEEADYICEGAYLKRYGDLLEGAQDYQVPTFHADLTTQNVLSMDYVGGVPVESLTDAPQEERDHVVTLLINLVFREMFDFNLMQTDPNFANYRYDRESRQLVLLDFGATREIDPAFAGKYRQLMVAGHDRDHEAIKRAAIDIGFFDEATDLAHQQLMAEVFEIGLEPQRQTGPFDFGSTDLAERLREKGLEVRKDRDFAHLPPIDSLYLHRKFGGTYLLASRLKARVDVNSIASQYL
ncbi:AarF/ABC1/UbiB kinase family protein [Parvularcula sp. IMCC14364]|uniref:ABC1 kinase family protein n=1 Tax=Parvularcula sp. IMCC14364 TaxID=3067902 RepID=UPI002741ACA9|nr:AarF/ABC1/UbiB kinase family protein [Parvularcula sp. IMCC14364]